MAVRKSPTALTIWSMGSAILALSTYVTDYSD